MLAKLFPRYVIAGVIQNSYYARYMAVDLSKQIIGETTLPYHNQNPKHYFECNFFGHLSTLDRPTEFSSQFEAEKYEEACERFRQYNEVKLIYERLSEFTRQIRELFKDVEVNNTSSNFFSRGTTTDKNWEEDLEDCLNRYNALLAQLEPYPEWHAKVVEEVGHWFHMIHNNLSESDSKRNIFLKMNRQEYFV